MLAVRIAGISHHAHLIGANSLLALHRHRMKLLQIIALIGQLEGDDQLVLGIDRGLCVVGDRMAIRRPELKAVHKIEINPRVLVRSRRNRGGRDQSINALKMNRVARIYCGRPAE